jgi:hypothetical protein
MQTIGVYAEHHDEVAMPVPDGMHESPQTSEVHSQLHETASGNTGTLDSNQNVSDRSTNKYSLSNMMSGNYRELREA